MRLVKKFRASALFGMVIFAFVCLTSCSQDSDNEEYQSLPPEFSDMQVTNVSNPGGELTAGDEIKFTGIQSKNGHLLLGTTYTWSVSPDVEVEYEPVYSVNYGVNSSNPANVFKFANPGTYRVTLQAKYATAGSKGMTEGRKEQYPERKCNISYEVMGAAFFYYLVTIDKYVTIK